MSEVVHTPITMIEEVTPVEPIITPTDEVDQRCLAGATAIPIPRGRGRPKGSKTKSDEEKQLQPKKSTATGVALKGLPRTFCKVCDDTKTARPNGICSRCEARGCKPPKGKVITVIEAVANGLPTTAVGTIKPRAKWDCVLCGERCRPNTLFCSNHTMKEIKSLMARQDKEDLVSPAHTSLKVLEAVLEQVRGLTLKNQAQEVEGKKDGPTFNEQLARDKLNKIMNTLGPNGGSESTVQAFELDTPEFSSCEVSDSDSD